MFYGVFGTERVMGRCVCGGRGGGGGNVFSGKDDISLLRRQLSEAKLWLYLATIGKNDANEGSMMAMVVMIEVADRRKKLAAFGLSSLDRKCCLPEMPSELPAEEARMIYL